MAGPSDPFDPSTSFAFYVLVALAQMAVAAILVARHPRREWAWTLAGLFVANAGYAASSALRADPFPGAWLVGHRAGAYFDHASFLLLAYLALTFPSRPPALRRVRFLLPGLLVAALATVFVLDANHVEWLANPRNANAPVTIPSVLVAFAAPAAVWSLLLVRWTRLWLQPMSESLRTQFKLVFAAVAMRAANQLLATLVVVHHDRSQPWLVAAAQGLNVAALLALAGCVVALVVAQSRQAGVRRSQTQFLLTFAAVGLVAGSSTINLGGIATYFSNAFSHLDLYVARPLLVWMAFLRPPPGRPVDAASRVFLWLLFTAGAFNALAPGFTAGVPEGVRTPIGLAVGAGIATAVLFLALPRFLAPAPGAGLDPGLAAYRAAVEEAYRNGEPGGPERRALDRLRRDVGITSEQHAALVQQSQGQGGLGLWGPGTVALGRYRIEGLLGAGSAGEAFAAHDVLTGEDVVLKRTRRLDPFQRRAILREAEALARLSHPNLVRLLRTEFLGDEPVLVLERLSGSLRARLDAGPLSGREAVAVAADVLSALRALHEAGLVHADVKPTNILLSARGSAKLSDLGASRPAPAALLGDPTMPAVPTGTLRYMAPECLQGAPSDGRADVYAVGVVLHEMLSGRHPVAATTDYGVRKAIVEGRLAPLPAGVPTALRQTVLRALHADPGRRHPSAAAFAKALDEALAAAPTPGTPGTSARPPARRRTPGDGPRPSAAGPS